MDEGTPRPLLEGRPGIGKSTLARRLAALLQEAGVSVGGSPRASRYGVDLAAFERVALPALRDPGPGGVVRVTESARDALPQQLRDRLVGTRSGEER